MLFLIQHNNKSIVLNTATGEEKSISFAQLRKIRFTSNQTFVEYYRLDNETFVLHELINPSAYHVIFKDVLIGMFFLPRGQSIYDIIYDTYNAAVYVRLNSMPTKIMKMKLGTQLTEQQNIRFRKEFGWSNNPANLSTQAALNTNGVPIPETEFITLSQDECFTILSSSTTDRLHTGFNTTGKSEFKDFEAIILNGQGIKLYNISDLYFRHNRDMNFDLLDIGGYEDVPYEQMMVKALFPRYQAQVLGIYRDFSQQYRGEFSDCILNYKFSTKLWKLNREFVKKTKVIDIVSVLDFDKSNQDRQIATNILYCFSMDEKVRNEVMKFRAISR